MQELEKRELLILQELVAANVPSNLEAPGLDGLRVRFRSPLPTRNNVWLLPRMACD